MKHVLIYPLLFLLAHSIQAQEERGSLRSLYKNGEKICAYEISLLRDSSDKVRVDFLQVLPREEDGFSTYFFGTEPKTEADEGGGIKLSGIDPDTWMISLEAQPRLLRFGDLIEGKTMVFSETLLFVKAREVVLGSVQCSPEVEAAED